MKRSRLAAVAWCALVAVAVRLPAEPAMLSGHAMGTSWSVKFVQPDSPLDEEVVAREVADRLEQLEQQFSTYRPQSELSRFNANESTGWIPVSPEIARVAAESQRISALTGGAFDVTVLPLVRLWGFAAQRRFGSVPSSAEITTARALVDWRRLEVQASPPALRKAQPRIGADFSSMAKGYAADAISELVATLGAPSHLVLVGGDVKSGASKTDGDGWHTAIEQPIDDVSGIACVVTLSGQALSTSGDYRNFFKVGRRRYGHIIDPRTGQPPSSSLASVSVVAASCATSSALATGLFVLGADEGMRLARANHLACLFLLRRGTELERQATPEFEALLLR